jgi:hypothetical protein
MHILKVIGNICVGIVIAIIVFGITSMFTYILSIPIDVIFNDNTHYYKPLINWHWYYTITVPAVMYLAYQIKVNCFADED